MGCYMYVSEDDRVSKRKVDDPEINEAFQEALKYDPSLMIEEHKRYKKKLFKDEYVQKDIWWDIYHETPALDGSAYQARWQISGSGEKKIVVAYLHGIINCGLHSSIEYKKH